MDEVRLDQWLTAARIFKSRSLAQQACEAGHVSVNDIVAKCSRPVRVGDHVVARSPRGQLTLEVIALLKKRQSAPIARLLYEDHSPPVVREPHAMYAVRERGAGRPTKQDRREIMRLRGELEFD